MPKNKMKEHAPIHSEKRADEEVAMAAQLHFSVAAVCGWVEKLHSEWHKKSA